ncbi:MAG: hypothetical protein A3K83_05965 [Omnitrophica WOR_2 bacterium RBG_13_44_8b]|nr:MAG: hypothetical protein A3K83_05965 [Omnitrophica WOR_2 bacterium RBG_13_44_8b]
MQREKHNSHRPASCEGIRETAFGFQRSRILLTAFELDLFSALGEGSRTAAEVSRLLNTSGRATQRLMNALCVIQLLHKKGTRFSNTCVSLRYLCRKSSQYMAGLGHYVHLWNSWSNLSEAVRTGKPVRIPYAAKEGQRASFIAAMHEIGSNRARKVVTALNLKGVYRVLDIGCGSGVYSMAFAKAKEEIRVTAFDLSQVVTLARGYIEREGLCDRVTLAAGDYLHDDFERGFDLVFLSAVIHSNSPQQNQALLSKCSRSLKPRGQLVIQDFIMDKSRTSPVFGAFFALNMLVATEAGDTYCEAEVRAWMSRARMTGIIRKDTPFGTTLVIGRKAAH